MLKIIFSISVFLIFSVLPVFSAETENNKTVINEQINIDSDEIKDEKQGEAVIEDEIDLHYYRAHRKSAVNRWRRGPKAEHVKIKNKGDIFVEKHKEQFKTRVRNELYLLKEEYEALDYSP